MADQSHLDSKYFIDDYVYNCPFCNRRNVAYYLLYPYSDINHTFNWSKNKLAYVYFVQCSSCEHVSMHLSYEKLATHRKVTGGSSKVAFRSDIDLDSNIFYSVPSSFFTLDNRIHEKLRELIAEAEGALKMNFLTGASACVRKAIYEFLVLEGAQGQNYQDKIKFLKSKYPNIDADLFDELSHIQGMTSDKVHEQSWPHWTAQHIRLLLFALKEILHEVYVIPVEKKTRSYTLQQLREQTSKGKKN